MKLNLYDRIMLTVIALFLGAIALRPLITPEPVRAQGEAAHVYIEPGTVMLHNLEKDRHVLGKVVVDTSTGKIWGFPTTTELPYPVDNAKPGTVPVSRPIYLGKYDFAAMGQ
jgi:hypothetical protein